MKCECSKLPTLSARLAAERSCPECNACWSCCQCVWGLTPRTIRAGAENAATSCGPILRAGQQRRTSKRRASR